VTGFKIINTIQEVADLLVREQLVALTAPLILDHTVIVGFYSTSGDQGCMEVSGVEFNEVGELLFQPTRTRIAVHGLKRIRQYPNIDTSELDLDLVTDTKLMAYLLNPDAGKEEAEGLSLSHLAYEYLDEDYPHMAVEARDKGYPEAVHDALVHDARTIHRLAGALPVQMDKALYDLYQRVELPLMVVLDSMRRVGVGIDGKRAYEELRLIQQEMDSLTHRITNGVSVDLSSDQEVFQFL
jgi:DNA polymerase I-like protein with 3'-5' exonuclease and polymerase domains